MRVVEKISDEILSLRQLQVRENAEDRRRGASVGEKVRPTHPSSRVKASERTGRVIADRRDGGEWMAEKIIQKPRDSGQVTDEKKEKTRKERNRVHCERPAQMASDETNY